MVPLWQTPYPCCPRTGVVGWSSPADVLMPSWRARSQYSHSIEPDSLRIQALVNGNRSLPYLSTRRGPNHDRAARSCQTTPCFIDYGKDPSLLASFRTRKQPSCTSCDHAHAPSNLLYNILKPTLRFSTVLYWLLDRFVRSHSAR